MFLGGSARKDDFFYFIGFVESMSLYSYPKLK